MIGDGTDAESAGWIMCHVAIIMARASVLGGLLVHASQAMHEDYECERGLRRLECFGFLSE
jgi:hypothetical protein